MSWVNRAKILCLNPNKFEALTPFVTVFKNHRKSKTEMRHHNCHAEIRKWWLMLCWVPSRSRDRSHLGCNLFRNHFELKLGLSNWNLMASILHFLIAD